MMKGLVLIARLVSPIKLSCMEKALMSIQVIYNDLPLTCNQTTCDHIPFVVLTREHRSQGHTMVPSR
jgi:hypothetical protein